MDQRRYIFALWIAVLTLLSGVTARAAEPRPIDGFSDHSFLLEEAYNQDRGEVQHTLNAVYSNDFWRRGWSFNFEQEWWLFTEDHQVAFSIPFFHLREEGNKQRGLGDIQIEYRYQLTEEGKHSCRCAWVRLYPSNREPRQRNWQRRCGIRVECRCQ